MSKIMQDIYDQGQLEGFKEGFIIGFKEGFKEGFRIGREESQIEITVNMLKYGKPVEFIAEVLEMPVEKIIEIGKAHALI